MAIPAGHVAGMDVHWNGELDGHDAVRIRQRWLASAHVDPAWTVEHGYRIEVAGDPNLSLKLDIWPTDADLADLTKATMHSIGMRITAVPVVKRHPPVCAAPPGLTTYGRSPDHLRHTSRRATAPHLLIHPQRERGDCGGRAAGVVLLERRQQAND